MLYLQDLTKSFGARTLFSGVTLTLSKKRTALVGANGSGKTTFLRILAGLDHADRGTITAPKGAVIAYLPQQAAYAFAGTIYAAAAAWRLNDRLERLRREEQELLERLEETPDERLYAALAEIGEEIHRLEVHERRKNAVETVLLNLGFPREMWDRPVAELSGGWQMRLALARLLIQEPDILLLDEPTNYLDIAAIDYLADWLEQFGGQALFVSHDRDFQNRLAEETWEIFNGTIDLYRGNYDYYLEEKRQRLALLEKQREKQLDELRHLQDFVDRNRYNAATASLAQSKLKQIEKIRAELIELPPEPPTLTFRLPSPRRGGDIVAELAGITHRYGDLTVIRGYRRIVKRGERIAVLGRNGFGKSTLMNIVGGDIAPSEGTVRLGTDITVSFFRQHETTLLPAEERVLDFVSAVSPLEMRTRVKAILGAFLFTEDDWDKRIGVLSGGEKSRLAFIRLMLNPGNLILLDEPTTHLDIASKEVLLRTLQETEATLVFVSHDTHFVNSLATAVAYFRAPGDIVDFPGTYAEYLGAYGHDFVASAPETMDTEKKARDGQNAFLARKDLRNRLNKAKRELERIEAEIARLEEEKKTLADELARGGDYGKIGARMAEADKRVATLMEQWETAVQAYEELRREAGE